MQPTQVGGRTGAQGKRWAQKPLAVWFQTSLCGHVALWPWSQGKASHRAALQFSGLWYVASMVSDCKVFLGKKDHLLMSTRAIKAMVGGNLSVHMEFPRADGCHQVDAEYLRVGSEGHFRVPALGYLDVRIVDTDYNSFAVVFIYKELEGALSTMVQLYSRTQEASPQAVKIFRDFYPTVGLPDDMMVMLPKSDMCSSGDKEAP
ncbi:lipocalin-15 isoform X1 [Leptonychotes weddellii]|uniref:Lipocalin-15 isoform X1 n=1 Tax=Leptonychotes weddellii TaxID=9713 RepID=A0A7F8RVC4_LEPWE|nr:lipocalin-15 isoform X1 [Leptonychotes weddellii]